MRQPVHAFALGISIHAPREGGDFFGFFTGAALPPFQSTPPARGATVSMVGVCSWIAISIHAPREGGDGRPGIAGTAYAYFNPRPPRGGRPFRHTVKVHIQDISIHAPREGGDRRCRPPLGINVISIHAPREGGDLVIVSGAYPLSHFNPRPPRGGRRFRISAPHGRPRYFNPRPPRGGRQQRCTVLPVDL